MSESAVLNMSPAMVRLVDSIVVAARSLSLGGHDDFNQGQVSARLPGSDTFFITSANTGFDECTRADVLSATVNTDATGHPGLPPEVVLHQATYDARPDVNAIVHSHAVHTLVFGATDLPLRAVSHDGALFEGRLDRFKLTSLTILDVSTARSVATALGQHDALLLLNHGGVCVGKSIRHATVYAHILERACRIQLLAESVPGGFHSASGEDVSGKREFNFADLSVRSYWEYLTRLVSRRLPLELGDV